MILNNAKINYFKNKLSIKLSNMPLILVCGPARGGTTFIMQVLNKYYKCRIIFEPFDNRHTLQFPIKNRCYIRYNENCQKLYEYINNLLKLKVNNSWLSSVKHPFFYRGIMIKAVRSNFILGYIIKNFPFIKIFYVYRDIYKIAYSRYKLNWEIHLDDLIQKNILSDLNLTVNFFQEFRTPIEKHLATVFLEQKIIEFQKELGVLKDVTFINLDDIFSKDVKYAKEYFYRLTGYDFSEKILYKPSITSRKKKSNYNDLVIRKLKDKYSSILII